MTICNYKSEKFITTKTSTNFTSNQPGVNQLHHSDLTGQLVLLLHLCWWTPLTHANQHED